MDKKRGVAIELAVFAMVIATALGGLIVTNLLFSSSKTGRLLKEAKERAEIDYIADEYLKDSSKTEYNDYIVKPGDGGFEVEKGGEVKLTVKIGDGKIIEWKY
ncbi:MAG: hypothetical protein J5836_01140 [Clostridia bacterium]|nr:hypothetical protein [Clostridia bacterium]